MRKKKFKIFSESQRQPQLCRITTTEMSICAIQSVAACYKIYKEAFEWGLTYTAEQIDLLNSRLQSHPRNYLFFLFFFSSEIRISAGMLRMFICSHVGLCCELAESHKTTGKGAWDLHSPSNSKNWLQVSHSLGKYSYHKITSYRRCGGKVDLSSLPRFSLF